LSGLFEAARLKVPEVGVELIEEEEEVEESEAEGETTPDLPDVPRPPLNLSQEDWKILDDWMQKYVENLFAERMQEFTITKEPAPRTEEVQPEEPVKIELPDPPKGLDDIDLSDFMIKEFPELQRPLLEKAMSRKVLYSPTSHEFLFGSEVAHRETESIQSVGTDPVNLLRSVIGVLLAAGMKYIRTIEEDGFSFILLRKDGLRASVSAGVSVDSVSIPVVLVGDNQKTVISLADKLRAAQGR
jgi:hypothetical protein